MRQTGERAETSFTWGGDSAPRSLHESKNMPELELLMGRNPLLLFLPRPELGTDSSLSSKHLGKLDFTHFQMMKGNGLGSRIGARFRSLFFSFPGRLAVHRCSVSCSPASSPLLPAVCERYRAGNAQNASVLPKPCLQGISAAQQGYTKASLV